MTTPGSNWLFSSETKPYSAGGADRGKRQDEGLPGDGVTRQRTWPQKWRLHGMNISFAYGKARVTVAVPECTHVDEYGPGATADPVTPDDFRRTFVVAGGEVVLSAERPLVIVNDGFRHTPTARFLTWLNEIDASLLDRADFLIATGTHASPSETHLSAIFGRHLDRVRARIQVHDASAMSTMVEVGTDRFGQPVFLNRQVFNHPQRLVIGSVEPHYFAGYSGGRKAIFPGLSDRATTERNHNLANSLEARPLRLIGNPVAEQLDELMALIPDETFFTIQAVLGADGELAAAFCGELEDAFAQATATAQAVYSRNADAPYDTVLCELLPPLDDNLYQAQKALENNQLAVKDGGAVVVLSACEGGVGSPHFFQQAHTWNREINQPGDGVFRFGSHKLSRVISISQRIEVGLYSRVDPNEAKQVFYNPIGDLQSYIAGRCQSIPGHRLAIVRDAGHTVVTHKLGRTINPLIRRDV